ncbi:MAG: peptide chain release factor N(5)-glutamine methyltransferase [Myxococcota bacterium]
MAEDWTVMRVLDWTRDKFEAEGIDNPRLDAELLLSAALGMPRIQLYARFDQPLTAEEREATRSLVRRRLEREPVAYILGRKEFWSLDLAVDDQVLIPRPDTELMVERALDRIPKGATSKVIDVGTGSGAIALAFKTERPEADVYGADLSASALEVARQNAERLGLALSFVQADLLPPEPRRFDLILANLPYIPSREVDGLMPEVSLHEPRLALDGGENGLEPIERLVVQLPERLAPGGFVLLECGPTQTDAVAGLLEEQSLTASVYEDLGGLPRLVEARQRGAPTTTGSSSTKAAST